MACTRRRTCSQHVQQATRKHNRLASGLQEYEADYDWLMRVSQEDLIEDLRSKGRRQAATRQLRSKQAATVGASGGGDSRSVRRLSTAAFCTGLLLPQLCHGSMCERLAPCFHCA
jgi:hypothetical protein